MPFLSPDRKPIIRCPQGHPVAVITAFNTIGDFIPRFFCIEDDNCELFKYKVSAVKSIKDKYMVKTFHCNYDAYGFRNDIMLSFDVKNHLWVIG